MGDSLKDYQFTVWGEFTPLALQHQAVNLGQGFPAFPAPSFIKEALYEGTMADHNQYARIQGFMPLVQQIATVYSRKYAREVNPLTEVLVTFGGSEGLTLAFLGLLNPGEEAVLFDPSFDLYYPQASLAGAKVTAVPMHAPVEGSTVWEIDWEAFESAFTPRTRLFVMNTPHNPLGKVYTPEELQRIADVLERFPDVWIISDEVYEHLVYGGREFRSIGTYGSLWSRCGTLSSAGKLFSVTGWKTGWVVGGEQLIKKLTLVKQWTTFTSNTPCQYAVCKALAIAEQPYLGFPTYYAWLHNEYDRKRLRLLTILSTCQVAELEPLQPEGGFFVIARIKSAPGLTAKDLENTSLDYALARWLTVQHRVTAIPCSSFFTAANKQIGQTFLRFALCKTDEDYEVAAQRLQCPH